MNAHERRDNYRTALENTRELFLRYDQNKIAERFHLNADANHLHLIFVSRDYRIDRHTGAVECLNGKWRPAEYEDGMTIYDILCDAKEGARVSGRFENAWHRKNVSNSPNGSLFQNTANFFAGRCDALQSACLRLNGRKIAMADVGFEIPVFNDLSMRLLFWDADDEFPASLNLQFDENILDYMRYETTFYAAGFVLKRLRTEDEHERGMEKPV